VSEPTTRPPYESYATLVGIFGLGAVLASRASDPDQELRPIDIVALGLATFKASRTVARDKVASFARDPFVEGKAWDGEDEKPAGTGLKRAVGELVTCTRCIGMWIATVLAASTSLTPRFGRLLIWSLNAAALNDFLLAGFSALTAKANELEQRTSSDG
jgi:hypothetical protein